MTTPWWDPEPDRPEPRRSFEPLTCALCGIEMTAEPVTITRRTALYAPVRDAETGETIPGGYMTVARCLDVGECRSRLEARREDWPLVEPGEDRDKPHIVRREPMRTAAPVMADAVEEDDDRWF